MSGSSPVDGLRD